MFGSTAGREAEFERALKQLNRKKKNIGDYLILFQYHLVFVTKMFSLLSFFSEGSCRTSSTKKEI